MMSAPSADPRAAPMAGMTGHGGHDMKDMADHSGHHEHGGGDMPGPSLATVIGVSIATFLRMLAAAAVASLFAPITF
jgi:hypothetical protein